MRLACRPSNCPAHRATPDRHLHPLPDDRESPPDDLSSHARETLDLVRSHGCELSADDFETGYSSLSNLHKLRLKEIKIDRSFVHRLGLPEEPSDDFARAILAMGHALGLHIVAEGIENALQLAWLSENGCALGQGFYFRRVLDLDRFLDTHLRGHRPMS